MPRLAPLLAACLVATAACGGGEPAGSIDDTVGYFPADAGAVVVLSTDFESEQWQVFDREVARRAIGLSIENALRELAAELEVSYEDDIEPLLGNELVAGTTGPDGPVGEDAGFVAALQVTDEARLRDLLETVELLEPAGEEADREAYRLRDSEVHVALDGDVLVAAESRATLAEALGRSDGSDRLTQEAFDSALDGLPEDALIRVFGDAGWVFGREETAALREVPWFDALTTFGLAATFAEEEVTLEAVANTDGRELAEDELPLAVGEEAPEVVARPNEVAGGNANQSVTTVFLLRTAEVVFPDSRFVRRVHELEAELGIDFEEEILRQFDGPSVSLLGPDGQSFAARSEVRDPDLLREQLRALAPHLPELVEGLEGLTSQGLAALLLFAPDAPALPEALQGVTVQEPSAEDGLYRVSGLTGDGPAELYFGLVGDVFVVASDEARARDIAEAETEGIDGAEGAAAARLLLEESGALEERFGTAAADVEEVAGWVRASTDELRATLRIRPR
ncbi:MAG TPA: DUF3352 domain-containing protein [Gaiellaceae bacterium]|nr:DUF3352 domain-containing protein [Gaiellaceae bacterium]